MPVYEGDIERVLPSAIKRGDLIFLGYRYRDGDMDWWTVKGITVTKHNVYQFQCETLDSAGRRFTQKLAYRDFDPVPRKKKRRKRASHPKRLAG
ncbi:MAG TPA: hypothetical protein VMC78_14905 [Mycobacterium sp.]|jgi:hypothetical protein|nr:hypothetical protein [Mycobacterium sp.]